MYKVEIEPGSTLNFLELCKSDGQHYLGTYPRIVEEKNCKKELKVSLTLMERERDNIEWAQKFSRIVPIERCEHEEECKFLNQHEIICGGTPSLPHGMYIGKQQSYCRS